MVVADRARLDLDAVAKERLAALHNDDELYAGVQASFTAKQQGQKAKPLSAVLAGV